MIMKYSKPQTFFIVGILFFLLSCRDGIVKNSPEQDSTQAAFSTVVSTKNETDKTTLAIKVDSAQLELIQYVEKEFFRNLKDIDKDFGENNFAKFTTILKRHKTTVFDLYIELSEIKKEAVSVARANGIEVKANGKERVLSNYYYLLEKEIATGKSSFQKKYGFDNRLLQCFENNYCFCYDRKRDVYCSGSDCKLINGEFWKYH
jgi:hypothetical protein